MPPRVLSRLLVPAVIVAQLLLGVRGLWHADRDFFAMHPFAAPAVACAVRAEAEGRAVVPPQGYRALRGNVLQPSYLETLPLYAAGIRTQLRRTHPDARVRIECQSIQGYPVSFFRVP